MAAAVPFFAMAAAGVQAVGQLYSAKQARDAYTAQAEQANVNATATRQASNAREEVIRRQMAARLAEQRAGAAQSGFDSSTGSFADLQGQSASNAELDALTTRYEGEMQALSLDNEAAGLRQRGRVATRQGYLNAAGSIMQGASFAYGGGTKFPSSSYNYSGDASGELYSSSGADIRARR